MTDWFLCYVFRLKKHNTQSVILPQKQGVLFALKDELWIV